MLILVSALFSVACGTSSTSTADAIDAASPPGDDGGGNAPPSNEDAGHGTDDAGALDAHVNGDSGSDDAGAPPAAASMPQVVNSGGGVLAQPKAIIISFPGDALAPAMEEFTTKIAKATYWATTTAEYGVGALMVQPPVHLQNSSPATVSDADVQSILSTALANPANAFGPADPSAIYTILIPPGVTETGPNGRTACQGTFGGYHGSFAIDGTTVVPYAVVVECTARTAPTRTLAHELVEAATNPFSATPAFHQVGPKDLAYRIAGGVKGTELGDMCENTPVATPADVGARVARIWSNQAARAGKNPCVPVPSGEPFEMALPTTMPPDTVTGTLMGGQTATGAGYAIATGQSRTITIGVNADGPSTPWTLSVREVDGAQTLGLVATATTLVPGATMTLTVTANADTSAGVAFAIDAKTSGLPTNTWYGLVGTP